VKPKVADPKTVPEVNSRFIPTYRSKEEDLEWAKADLVASVITGDSTLALQQRIEDAGFLSVVVAPLAGDKVFLHSTGGEDI